MSKKILMVAAENDSLAGAKVGGVGDVMRDLPAALVKNNFSVQCVIPSYGFLARLPKLQKVAVVSVPFAGAWHEVDVLHLPAKKNAPEYFIYDHPRFYPQGERVYCHDDSSRPFSSDATKFAFFCACIAQSLKQDVLPRPDVIHCHDWHSSFLLMLLKLLPYYSEYADIQTVFSIHNIAIQGTRPKTGDESSLQAWFPELARDIDALNDRKYPHCVNPLRAGICLADKVHTVSPSYAQEILAASDHKQGIYGGEGLEQDLLDCLEQGKLFGILNGCEYPRSKAKAKLNKTALTKDMQRSLEVWAVKRSHLASVHWLADKRLNSFLAKKQAGMLITSIGRLTDQKVRLLVHPVKRGVTVLEALLTRLGSKGCFLMLGSGENTLECTLAKISARHSNFIFLNGYCNRLANTLYENGDLFLMPSSFEPCGISQMLAMRAGQLCLVNQIGGLRDTVIPNRNGFGFEGKNIDQQAKALLEAFDETLRVYSDAPEVWARLSKSAKAQRFTWSNTAQEYADQLYS